MSNKKETPVSWLVDQFDLNPDSQYIKAVIDHALEMESKKQQKYDEMLEMLEKIIKYSLTRAIEAEAEQLIKEAKEL
jgi:hypothetical protein